MIQKRWKRADYTTQRLKHEGHTVVNPSTLRVLLCVLARAQFREPVTVRGLARDLGVIGINHIKACLETLRSLGLVNWEKGRDGEALDRRHDPPHLSYDVV